MVNTIEPRAQGGRRPASPKASVDWPHARARLGKRQAVEGAPQAPRTGEARLGRRPAVAIAFGGLAARADVASESGMRELCGGRLKTPGVIPRRLFGKSFPESLPSVGEGGRRPIT
jgi:hypothetical protein